jgi:hypothetical protein
MALALALAYDRSINRSSRQAGPGTNKDPNPPSASRHRAHSSVNWKRPEKNEARVALQREEELHELSYEHSLGLEVMNAECLSNE